MKRWLVLTALALSVVATSALIACSGYRHEAYRLDDKSKVSEQLFDLYFVEADDEGWFWQPEQAERAIKAVEESAQARDTFVLLFVHGWHHSSRCCDSNVQSFRKTLAQLQDELTRRLYADVRAEYSQVDKGERRIQVIGIYLGWRGNPCRAGSIP